MRRRGEVLVVRGERVEGLRRELLVQPQDDPPLGFTASAARPAHGVQQLRCVQGGDVAVAAPVAALTDEHAAHREVDAFDEGRRRHEVPQRAFPDAVLQLGLDVTGQGGVVEGDAAPEHVNKGMRRVQPGRRERDERGARRIVLVKFLRERHGRVLRRRLGRFDDEHRPCAPSTRRHPRADTIGGITLRAVSSRSYPVSRSTRTSEPIGPPVRSDWCRPGAVRT